MHTSKLATKGIAIDDTAGTYVFYLTGFPSKKAFTLIYNTLWVRFK